MSHLLDPVHQLEMRLGFMQGILEVGLLCNLNKKQLEEIQEMLLGELAYIDNIMYEIYEETGERDVAFAVWESSMEGLRRWLSLIMGIKIKYV